MGNQDAMPAIIAAMKTEGKKQHLILGGLCLLLGASIVMVAAGIIPVAEQNVHAPMWVVGLCGAVFVVAGVMIFAGPDSRVTAFGAALVCASFGAVGLWVAFSSEPGSISGGLPFLSRVANDTIGRWVFGLGSAISFLIAYVALRQVFGRSGR